jgi:molecular chaperone IbpA
MIWKEDEPDLIESIRKNVNLNLLGFEDFLNRLVSIKTTASYPHYNIEKLNENEWCIILAIAGFSKSDIEITLEGIQLIIKGTKPEEDSHKEYIYKGIATRSFQRSFLLADKIVISKASVENGLLKIYLKKPQDSRKVIKINIEENEE